MALRFLVVEGNPVGPRERHQATFGKTYSDSYGSVLQTIDPTSIYDAVLNPMMVFFSQDPPSTPNTPRPIFSGRSI